MLALHPHPLLVDRRRPKPKRFDRVTTSMRMDQKTAQFCWFMTVIIGVFLVIFVSLNDTTLSLSQTTITRNKMKHVSAPSSTKSPSSVPLKKTAFNMLLKSKLIKLTSIVLSRATIVAGESFTLLVNVMYRSWFNSNGWKLKPLPYDKFGGRLPKFDVGFVANASQSGCEQFIYDVVFFYTPCDVKEHNACHSENMKHIHWNAIEPLLLQLEASKWPTNRVLWISGNLTNQITNIFWPIIKLLFPKIVFEYPKFLKGKQTCFVNGMVLSTLWTTPRITSSGHDYIGLWGPRDMLKDIWVDGMKPIILRLLGLSESFVRDRWSSEQLAKSKKPLLLYIEQMGKTKNSRWDSEEFIIILEKLFEGKFNFQRLKESDWTVPHTKERLVELIRKIQSADMIMGRYGAGMQNALYASQGAVVFELKTWHGMGSLDNGFEVSKFNRLGYYPINWCENFDELHPEGCIELFQPSDWKIWNPKIPQLEPLADQIFKIWEKEKARLAGASTGSYSSIAGIDYLKGDPWPETGLCSNPVPTGNWYEHPLQFKSSRCFAWQFTFQDRESNWYSLDKMPWICSEKAGSEIEKKFCMKDDERRCHDGLAKVDDWCHQW